MDFYKNIISYDNPALGRVLLKGVNPNVDVTLKELRFTKRRILRVCVDFARFYVCL